MKHAGLILAVASVLVVGCGRRATEADCGKIVDRTLELKLKEMNMEDKTPELKDRLRHAFDDQLRDCVGRRISDEMMLCVERAASSDGVLACVK